MKSTLAAVALLIFSWAQGHAQNPENSPAFDVASITPCKPGTPEPPMEHTGLAQFISPGGRFTARATTVKFLLEWAYGIQPSQHSGGPSWIGVDRYDIVAKAADDATEEQIKLMTQALLADRFQLKLHRERREISAYVISQGKSAPKLSAPKDGETHSLGFAPKTSPDQKTTAYRLLATRYTLAQLADAFSRQLGGVIVNSTGLDGEYDFTLDLAPDESRPNPVDPTLLLAALRDQLGLTVKYQKTPIDLLVIDSAEKVAAGN
jgi:uncharacterized protein (TIGR03435 family)